MIKFYEKPSIVLILFFTFGLINGITAGTCWLKFLENEGKCQNIYMVNITKGECCVTGKGTGYTEKEMSEAEYFFITAIGDGALCTSCLESCENAKCGPNKRCVIRRGRPKCICAPMCKSTKKKSQESQQIRPKELINNGHKIEMVKILNDNGDIKLKPNNNKKKISKDTTLQKALDDNSNGGTLKLNQRKLNSNSRQFVTTTTSSSLSAVVDVVNKNSKNFFKESDLLLSELITDDPRHSGGSNVGDDDENSDVLKRKSDKMIAITAERSNNNNNNDDGVGVDGGGNKSKNVRHKNKKIFSATADEIIATTLTTSDSKKENSSSFSHKNRNRQRLNTNRRIISEKPLVSNHTFITIGNKFRSGVFNTLDNSYNWNFPLAPGPALPNDNSLHGPFYNPVCGTDGRTYKTECQLKKRACRQESTLLTVAYRGHCQTSCKLVKCQPGKHCLEDQNSMPHCVHCSRKCPGSNVSKTSTSITQSSKLVCGSDGNTYRNLCELQQKACVTGRAIPLAYKGPCKESANCDNIKCKERQTCLTDLVSHRPRCISCSFKCPRRKRPQGRRVENIKLCGTNNNTYHSWCQMMKDSCNTGYYIDVKHNGICKQDKPLPADLNLDI